VVFSSSFSNFDAHVVVFRVVELNCAELALHIDCQNIERPIYHASLNRFCDCNSVGVIDVFCSQIIFLER